MTGQARPLVEVNDLVVQYRRAGLLPGAAIQAVDGVSLTIQPGECVGLVGESGCGKSTLGRAILRGTPVSSGTLRFDGVDITRITGRRLRDVRRKMQMVFQDPYSSLNPKMTVERIVGEPIRTHTSGSRREMRTRVAEALEVVGIDPARMGDYPHQFSGGQRQRIGIARALAVRPLFILCDEATSALDVSIRAQILNLLRQLRAEFGLTYLMISHDLGSLRHLCDQIGVMYLGKLVETGSSAQIFGDPSHPYTKSLLSAMPVPDPAVERARTRIVLTGDVPSPMSMPSGCGFHTRCWLRQKLGSPERCHLEAPPLAASVAGGLVACHFSREMRDLKDGVAPAPTGEHQKRRTTEVQEGGFAPR